MLAAAVVLAAAAVAADPLVAARCLALCDAQPQCEATCAEWQKPGDCPPEAQLSPFAAACLDACRRDADCPGADRCCPHSCGVTCQTPLGLLEAPGLPPIPANVTVTARGRGAVVQWVPGDAEALYVLQERHHVGRHVSPERMGPWEAPRPPLRRPLAALRRALLPGRWYQFRVAAVNANGTRGFSPPSRPFKLPTAPRPPGPPQQLRVSDVRRWDNGTASARLSWSAPASELPVRRYRVFWSRQLPAPGAAPASLLVRHTTVPAEVTWHTLRNLEAPSLYFLQVQALADFGSERLKGEKASILLRTGEETETQDQNM